MSAQNETESTPSPSPRLNGVVSPRVVPPGPEVAPSAESPSAGDTAPAATLAVLASGELACAACGVAVPDAPDRPASVPFDAVAREGEGDLAELARASARRRGQAVPPVLRVELTRCAGCAERQALAERLVNQWPQLAGRLGTVAAHRLGCALDALAAAGLPVTEPADWRDAASMVNRLAVLGGVARFAGRFAPVAEADARASDCAAAPWAHLGLDQLAELRTAAGRVLAARVAVGRPPVAVPPPGAGGAAGQASGCVMCGVGAVALPAAEVAALGGVASASVAAWRSTVTSSAALGGPPAPGRLSGPVCPSCAVALAETGSVGLPAMAAALSTHLDRTGHPEAARMLRAADPSALLGGVIGWAAWRAQRVRRGQPAPAPNARPWQHVALVGGDMAANGSASPSPGVGVGARASGGRR